MWGRREGWLTARAEPVWQNAYRPQSEGQPDDFTARLEVHWVVHIPGREPYEVRETRGAPLWVIAGEYRGRHWYRLRLRASRGLLREVGVPCRVHPDKLDKLDVDWSAAYDEHQPVWDRMDAVDRGVAVRRDGPLGKLLAPLEYMRLPNYSKEEQQAIDRDAEAEAARLDRVTGVGATHVDAASLMAENELIKRQMKEAKRLRKQGFLAFATVLDQSGPTQPGSWLYTLRLEVHDGHAGSHIVEHQQGMNDGMAQQLKPGARIKVRVDPADPQKVALA